MKKISLSLLFLIYTTIIAGCFFNIGLKKGVSIEKENTIIEFNKIMNETEAIIFHEKFEKELLFYDFNQYYLYQENICIDSIKEVENMLVELYIFSKAKEVFFNNFLENSICLPKEEI